MSTVLRSLALFLFLLPMSSVLSWVGGFFQTPQSQTWFVRMDGGTRYSANVPTGQCNGLADAAYPGSGVNQPCAFREARYLWMDGTYGNYAFIGSAGDTYVIRSCSALAAQQNADNPHCRIGWDTSLGTSESGNTWCLGSNYCEMPPPPSGSSSKHTRLLSGCAYDGNCKPVKGWPYTGGNLTQLFAGFKASTALSMYGASYIDIAGFEITTHNGKCARYGTNNPLPACIRNVGDSPNGLSDQSDQGIYWSTGTHDITLTDVYIHGFSSNGIQGPLGPGTVTATRVNLSFNVSAGWNFDDGSGSADDPSAKLIQSYVTMVGNGCQEEYPITHTNYPAAGCWGAADGGFGDSWSGQNSSMDTFTCDHCFIAYNVKDGAMGPHTGIAHIRLTNSVWEGNSGQSGKWNSPDFLFQNNLVVGNCMRISRQMPGAARSFAYQQLDANGVPTGTNTTPGQGLTDYCRAAAAVFAFVDSGNDTVNAVWDHNTFITYQPTLFQLNCSTAPSTPCSGAHYTFSNNIYLGYTSTYGGEHGFNNGAQPNTYFQDDNAGFNFNNFNNVAYGMRGQDACGVNSNLCVDPKLIAELVQGGLPPETALDTFNAGLSSTSPARGAGATSSRTTDYAGSPASNDVGFLNFGNTYTSPVTNGSVAPPTPAQQIIGYTPGVLKQ